ncbi:MAG: glycosyltransferase [Deltaproteobacteria bacterium]|nr:glycosyltransferase [Deltaproteobacteria bacterium]
MAASPRYHRRLLPLFLLALPALHALWNVYAAVRTRAAVLELPAETDGMAQWPRVSVVVPARDERDAIEAATRAKLESDYPDLEIVLVDDRSTDGTSEIADRVAAEDPRVRVVHVRELPSGWLGKVHALARGVEAATGEWLVFSDADVHMSKSLLRRVVFAAEQRGLDFVGMMPRIHSNGLFIDAAISSFVRMLVAGARVWQVMDPAAPAAFGNGVFNMARRSVYEKTTGYEWVRLEIVDDQAFGEMMKAAGARVGIFVGSDDLSLTFYRSLSEAMRGLEKNGYTLLGQMYSHRLVGLALLLLYVEVGPLVALLFPETRVAGASILAVTAFLQVALARAGRRPVLPALLPSIGPLLFVAFAVRSAILIHRSGGVRWRDTFYPLEELRRGRRLAVSRPLAVPWRARTEER